MDWGLQNRISRIIKPNDNRALMLAVDHGYFLGPTEKLEVPRKTTAPLLKYCDSIMLTRGVQRTSIDPKSSVPIVLRVSGGSSIIGEDLSNEQITVSIKDAIRLNASALAMSIFVGSKYEQQTIVNLGRLVNEAEEYGIPVLAVTAVGKETRDMTRSQIVKAAFRVLTLKLGKAKVPMIMTNHTYDVIGSMFPQKEMGGGQGLKYAASNVVYLTKRKEKEGKEVIGSVIHCLNWKSRLTKENAKIDVRLTYDKGLDKHYGLLDLAIKYNIFKAVSTRIELPDGTKQYAKTINNEPDKFYTKSILNQIDKGAKKEFLYGAY